MTNIFYIDGELVSSDDASLPVEDLAILRGYGIFDLTRTYGGKPFRLDAHLERLERSAGHILLDLPLPIAEIRRIALDVLARNQHEELVLRIVVTGGSSPDNLVPENQSRLLVMVTPLGPRPEFWDREGVKLITNHEERYMPDAKTLNYIPAIIALKRARAQGAVDAIYIDHSGYVREGTTNNIFAFYGDRLLTPAQGVLSGITRMTVLELAAQDYQVEQVDLSLEDLLRADEVFLTSSIKEVCPVRQIDDTVIGPPGPKTCRLLALFRQRAPEYSAL